MNWMVPERRLDEHQLDVLRRCSAADDHRQRRLLDRDHHWIRGFAGTGKTVLLVHLAGRILAEQDEASICLATYTHALKDLMASGLGRDLAGRARVMTYYQLLHEGRTYDWILLDEVQDIPAADLRRIQALAGRVVAAGDTDQSIYDQCSTEREIRDCLDPDLVSLETLHRLTQRVRDIACCVMPGSRLEGATTARMQEVEVTLAHAETAERETEWLWERLSRYSRVGKPAVALFSTRKDVRRFLRAVCRLTGAPEPAFQGKDYDPVNEALQRHKVPLQYLGSGHGSLEESDRRSISYVMTYHSAKGLDFETVFLPGLTGRRTFWKDDEAIARRLFFVGLTRSRQNLFLSYHGAEPHPYLRDIPDRLLRHVECERPRSTPGAGSGEAPPQEVFF